MPRAVPSQIVSYLAAAFQKPEDANATTIHSYPGKALGFLELYDRLPHELIRLPGQDYAALAEAVATIRVCMKRFEAGAGGDSLRPIGRAFANAWRIIATLHDEVPASTHDLSFISDQVLQEMIGLDISAISADLQNGEWKGTTIIAGSCCEALLLYGLQTREQRASGTISSAVAAISWPKKAPNARNLVDRSWDLFSYTAVAHKLKLIADATRDELDIARDYRNLIHPAKTVREKVKCDRGTAYIAVGALEHLVSDLKRNL
jgi:hypothetical protein